MQLHILIIRVITKSDDCEAGVRFVYHEYDYKTELDDMKYYMYYQLIIKILEPRLKKGKNCIKRLSRRRKVLNVALKLGLVDLNTTVNVTGPFKPEL